MMSSRDLTSATASTVTARPQACRLSAEEPGAAPRGRSCLVELPLEVGQLPLALGETAIALCLDSRVLGARGLQLELQLLDEILPGVQLRLEALPLLGVDAALEGPRPAIEQAGDELARVERHCCHVAMRLGGGMGQHGKPRIARWRWRNGGCDRRVRTPDSRHRPRR